jgi:hypothetical protein
VFIRIYYSLHSKFQFFCGAVPYGLPNKIEEEDAKPNYEALIAGQIPSGFCCDTCKAVRISFGAGMIQRSGSDPFIGRAHGRSVGGFLDYALTVGAAMAVSDSCPIINRSEPNPFAPFNFLRHMLIFIYMHAFAIYV